MTLKLVKRNHKFLQKLKYLCTILNKQHKILTITNSTLFYIILPASRLYLSLGMVRLQNSLVFLPPNFLNYAP